MEGPNSKITRVLQDTSVKGECMIRSNAFTQKMFVKQLLCTLSLIN